MVDGGPGLPWVWGALGSSLPSFFNPKMSPLAIAVCKEAVEVMFWGDEDVDAR